MDLGKKTLRRRSFVALSWIMTIPFGMVSFGAAVSMSDGVDVDAFAVMAACLGVIAVARRILGSRITLGESELAIVNPVVTYTVPYGMIAAVSGGTGGTLTILTRQADEIHSTGFGGSLIDHFVGSTDRAVEQIKCRLKHRPKHSGKDDMQRRFTVAWFADTCGVGALFCAASDVIVGM
ncbi:hypothetical protein [Streptomyces spongiicola]|uniref:hypothetical protein n=1 Tax=Streptomyces spongiicola TaxID=1690221 RepID=UPI0013A5A09D|nr:hypothetical protein [Streptomyces spongiicola]